MSPHVALAGLLAALAVGALCSALAPRAFANLTCVLVVTAVMWPRLYELAIPPRFALAVFLALGAVSCALCMSATVASRTLVAVIVLGFTGIMLVAFLGFQVATAGIGDSYFRYFAVAPLSVAYGYLLVRSGRVIQMGYALLAVAVISSILAVVEYMTGGPILAGNPFDEFRDGHFRAAVFSEHTLVFSSLLLCALAVAVVATQGTKRVIAVVVLFAGIATTIQPRRARAGGGLRSCGGGVGLRAGHPSVRCDNQGVGSWNSVGRGAADLFLSQPAAVHGITSSDPTVASAQYRGAIYSVTLESLRSSPAGLGASRSVKGCTTHCAARSAPSTSAIPSTPSW